MFDRITAYATTGLAAVLALGVSAQANTLLFDFGEITTPTGGNYNNVTQNQLPIFNALDTTGAGTGIGLTTSGFNPGSNTNGTQTPGGTAGATFDAAATRDNLFGHTVNFNQPAPLPLATLSLSGLDGSGLTTYDFVFFGSRLGVTDNRETQYVVTGANNATGYLDTSGNTDNVAVVSGIIPNALGQVSIAVSPGPNNNNSSGFYYLGAMQIIAVPEPAGLALMGLGGLFVAARRR
jgi:hypothetical protein